MPLRCFCLVLALLAPTVRAQADAARDAQRLLRAGDLPGALQRAQQASADNPRDAQLRFLQSVILIDLRRDDEALALLLRLTEEFPGLPEPYNNIALLHARAGRLGEARAALETALRNDPQQATARQNLGDIQMRLAIEAWQAAAAATPGDVGLQRKLQMARELIQPLR